MLRIRNLESGYGDLRVLKGISLHIRAGEIVAIIGANGAGKTTLLTTITGLLKVRSGEVLFAQQPIHGLTTEHIVGMGCALVPEGRQVFTTLSVRENLLLGAYLRHGDAPVSRERALAEVFELFPRLEERCAQLAGTLSGGEQQMLAMGRVLMAAPKLIMLDEPSMGLAPLVVKTIFSIITRLKQQGNTILLVEQNARAALAVAERGYVMETGQIVLEGTARELLDNNDVQRAYLGKDYKKINE
jgi:branched-chain amino acid transport system ATP-binding protein